MNSKAELSSKTALNSTKAAPLKVVAKWIFALALIALLIKSGKLSPQQIAQFFQSPRVALLCFALISLVVCLNFWRWQILLRALGFRISYFTAFRLGMVGMFFSTVIPGTVGGDLVKGVYVARRYPLAKTRVVSTIILDRLSGLIAVIIWGGIAFAIGHSRILALPSAVGKVIAAFGTTLLGLAIVLIVSLLVYPVIAKRLPQELPAKLTRFPGSSIFKNLYQVVLDFRQRPFVLWGVVALSMGLHTLNFSVMGLIAYAIHGAPPWGQLEPTTFLLSAVLGVCAMSIPVAPMGLGVGQLAFSTIFLAVGAPDADFGSGIITNNQIIQLVLGLIGLIFFLSYRHESEASETSTASTPITAS